MTDWSSLHRKESETERHFIPMHTTKWEQCEQQCLESVATAVNKWDACAVELTDSGE